MQGQTSQALKRHGNATASLPEFGLPVPLFVMASGPGAAPQAPCQAVAAAGGKRRLRARALTAAEVSAVFDQYDTDGSGYLSLPELEAALQGVGADYTPLLARSAFRLADLDGNNRISRAEFHSMWRVAERRQAGEVLEHWLYLAQFTGLTHMVAATAHTADLTTVAGRAVPRGADPVAAEVQAEVQAGPGAVVAEQHESPKPRLLVAGALTGATQKTVMAPLSRLIILKQVGSGQGSAAQALQTVVRTEGVVRGLWRGNGVNVVRVAPSAALNYTTYEVMKWVLVPANVPVSEAGVVINAASGAVSGMVAATATYPLDLLRTRLCTSPDPSVSLRSLARTVYTNDGTTGFYRGLGVTLTSVVPSFALNWAVYEKAKRMLSQAFPHEGNEPSTLVTLSAGVVAGTLASSLVYPLDVLRRRSQMAGNTKSPAQLARHTFAKFGVRGLYRGFNWYLVKSVPAAGVSYTCFEYYKYWLGA